MTFGDRAEAKRAKVGAKVLAFGCAIFAVLGSFWTIVWFIRSYVEPPRVTISPALALAARDSTPVTPPAKPAPAAKAEAPSAPPHPTVAAAVPPSPLPIQAAPAEQPSSTTSLSDRWMPMAPAPEPAPAPALETTASVPSPAPAEPPADEIAESSTPSIAGRAPLPRRKPMQTAAVRARSVEPPLPRPRPDGPAPQSIWTAVPTTDDRYQAGQ